VALSNRYSSTGGLPQAGSYFLIEGSESCHVSKVDCITVAGVAGDM
jgi:hypothetical protein